MEEKVFAVFDENGICITIYRVPVGGVFDEPNAEEITDNDLKATIAAGRFRKVGEEIAAMTDKQIKDNKDREMAEHRKKMKK